MTKPKITNPELIKLISSLRKESREKNVGIWRDIAKRLSKPRRNRVAVNLSRLNRYTEKKETVVVPGKVLSAGKIDHPITVAAFAFSSRAMDKIKAAKGESLSILQLMKKNPKGSNIKIVE